MISNLDNFIQSKIQARYKITHMDVIHRTIEMKNTILFNVRPWQLMIKQSIVLPSTPLTSRLPGNPGTRTQIVILPGGVVIGSSSLDLAVFRHLVWSETDFSILFTL
jgi:hypothetical protein